MEKSKIKSSFEAVAKELKKEPSEVSKFEYFASDHSLSDYAIRMAGGFLPLRTALFPSKEKGKAETTGRIIRTYTNSLKKLYATDAFLQEEFLSALKEQLDFFPLKPKKKRRNARPRDSSSRRRGTLSPQSVGERTVIAHLSDTHFGCNISKEEMGGVNEFNWQIAARRLALFAEQVVTYKPQHRDQTELVILLNGDIIAGVIHDQEWAVDLLATQFAGALHLLQQTISYCADHYSRVRVICSPGNHGRAMHKTNKSRATTHKWDSYETMIYIGLREILSRSRDNVEFVIPESPYAIFEASGHSFLVTHGDTVVSVGNPGKNLNMKSINDQINKLNSGFLPGTRIFAGVFTGHVHIPTVQLTDSGTFLFINGTLSGADAFAQAVGVFSNHPTQTIVEVVKEHGPGDVRIAKLVGADKQGRLDQIIKPFRGKF